MQRWLQKGVEVGKVRNLIDFGCVLAAKNFKLASGGSLDSAIIDVEGLTTLILALYSSTFLLEMEYTWADAEETEVDSYADATFASVSQKVFQTKSRSNQLLTLHVSYKKKVLI